MAVVAEKDSAVVSAAGSNAGLVDSLAAVAPEGEVVVAECILVAAAREGDMAMRSFHMVG